MKILGLSAFYHDSAACLVVDGEIIAAAQEERFSRKKHDERFPKQAAQFCLDYAGLKIEDIDQVVFYDQPFLKFERLLETYLGYAPRGLNSFLAALPSWLKDKFWLESVIKKELDWKKEIKFFEHHQSHAASAFYPSPFERAAILTVDGVGEWATCSLAHGRDNKIEILEEIHFPHSLGLLYSAFTYYTGFKVNSGEYKVMGLAPYGEPKYVQTIYEHLLIQKSDGSFALNLDYFNFAEGLTMTNERFHKLFGGQPRQPESPLTQKEMDLAASIQVVIEEAMLKLATYAKEQTGEDYLCLAGGVALNCVANGRILREGPFKDIWIQPAAGDAGGALGAALLAWYQTGASRPTVKVLDHQQGSYLGPEFTKEEIAKFLREYKLPARELEIKELTKVTAKLLSEEKVIGWFQGRAEFGPRALGHRSILADPRSPRMQSQLNLKIKYRESFRPFAPSIKAERVNDYFELDRPSPYMLLVAKVQPKLRQAVSPADQGKWGIEQLNIVRSTIPAVTHLDYSARIQTVHPETNRSYWQLLDDFEQLTSCPVLVNTSFNVRGEPIVNSPLDAYRCFRRTEMDYLVLGNYLLSKDDQPEFIDNIDWQKTYDLD